jgi:sugar lactone lactonase YvrE
MRALLAAVALLFAAVPLSAQVTIRSLTGIIAGHAVGGVTLDLVGNIYVADFGDVVWRITPEGERSVFATGLYGASGNTIDAQGNLLQSSFYGNSITKVDRQGHATVLATQGLNGPVGLAIRPQTGDLYVANCRANSIGKVARDGTVTTFAMSDLLRCPNGMTFDRSGNLYVVNFRDNRMLRIDTTGAVAPFATVSDHGLGHLCFKDDRFYVAAYESHAIYEVALDGSAKRILGTGQRGMVDGPATQARLSFPNGIACSPYYPRLYLNEYVAASTASLPRRAIVREITLGGAH